ncbi:MAG: class I SAM-dependent methyltransferase [Thermodesulfovibrionia bacterium]|nr:class I SAM-dependent methyltransferase [Thermodesulfovibrionia bacterium]
MNKITTPLITKIEEIVKDVPGWSPTDQLYTLFNLVYLNPDLQGNIVEIGSWCGRSTSVLGLAARLIGNTNIICIDLFPEKSDWQQNEDGSYSFEVTIGDQKYTAFNSQTVWKEPFERDIAPLYNKHNGIYDIFMETVNKNNLSDIVTPHKGTSDMINKIIPEDFKCKLAFLDGDHSYEAVCQDIKNVEPFLVEGGWICFDDAFSSYEGVNQAITDLIINNSNYELCRQMTRKFFVARKKPSV